MRRRTSPTSTARSAPPRGWPSRGCRARAGNRASSWRRSSGSRSGGRRRILREQLGHGGIDLFGGANRIVDRQVHDIGYFALPDDLLGLGVDQIHHHGPVGVGLDPTLDGHRPRRPIAPVAPSISTAAPTPAVVVAVDLAVGLVDHAVADIEICVFTIGQRESLGGELGLDGVTHPLVEQLLRAGVGRHDQREALVLRKAGGRTVVRADLLAGASGGQNQTQPESDPSTCDLHMLLHSMLTATVTRKRPYGSEIAAGVPAAIASRCSPNQGWPGLCLTGT